MSRPTFVIGGRGQVGRALIHLLGERARPVGRDDLDMSDPDRVTSALDGLTRQSAAPAAVINAAAFTRVDAESNEAQARRVNAESPRLMAEWCRNRAIPFVHYSTDYVYSGAGDRPWHEDDPPAPPCAYGRTKLEGDRLVADQVGALSYAPHLARGTLAALDRATALPGFPSGIYHLANTGTVSWHGFASAICEAAARHGLPLVTKRSTRSRPATIPSRHRVRSTRGSTSPNCARHSASSSRRGWQASRTVVGEWMRANRT